MDFEAIAKTVLAMVITSTQTQVNEAVDKAAASIVAAVKNTETSLDETIVKDALAPALARFASQLQAGLSA